MIASADVSLDQLFSTEKIDDGFISDEHRKLMDDLQISPDSVILFDFSVSNKTKFAIEHLSILFLCGFLKLNLGTSMRKRFYWR